MTSSDNNMPGEVERYAGDLKAAGRGDWITSVWDAFCDCDPLPGIDYDEYLNWLDGAPALVTLRGVDADDLDDAFASERGIEPGGLVYSLTPVGLAVRAALTQQESRNAE